MKRKYVKPVMESEEFVANEYVATCWQIKCVGYKADVIRENSHNVNQSWPWPRSHDHEWVGDVSHDKQSLENQIHPKFSWFKEMGVYTDSSGVEHYQVEVLPNTANASA